jgi:hypothetical protein
MSIDLGILFGLAGLIVALVSLVYVRTQATASRMQAEAARQQTEHARRLTALEISLRLSERTFEIRRDLLETPAVLEEYYRSNPGLRELFEGVGGMAAALMLRKMLDTFQHIYLLRQEGVVTDAHWANWEAAFRPFANIKGMRDLFDNAAARGIYDADFQRLVRGIMDGKPIPDPDLEGVRREKS